MPRIFSQLVPHCQGMVTVHGDRSSCGCLVGRCQGVSTATMQRAVAGIGPLLAASVLRSLTLVTWLSDSSFLRQLPSTLEVRGLEDRLSCRLLHNGCSDDTVATTPS